MHEKCVNGVREKKTCGSPLSIEIMGGMTLPVPWDMIFISPRERVIID
jgi:hypothetical protein